MSTNRRYSRASSSRHAPAALLLLAGLFASSGATLAQTTSGLPPIDAMPTPRFRAELAPQLHWEARTTEPARESPRISPTQAFKTELREEAIDYRFTNRWAYADEELLGDEPVRKGRSRAAENMLGDAAGAAMEVILRDALDRPRRLRSDERPQGVRHQLRVDSSPSWRLRTQAGLTRLRLDLPLSAHDDLSLRCTRPMDNDRGEREVGASVRVNPWEESIRFGFELEF